MKIKIISGGQSGCDQAALAAAVELGIDYQGYVPNTGAENLDANELLELYPKLKITDSDNNQVRTAMNILDADIILSIIPMNMNSSGTDFGLDFAAELGKPMFEIYDFKNSVEFKELLDCLKSFKRNVPVKIAIGGPREFECPGIFEESYPYLQDLLSELLTA